MGSSHNAGEHVGELGIGHRHRGGDIDPGRRPRR
jgi:hypothetical protein